MTWRRGSSRDSPRSELKRFLAAFRLELKRRVVQVGLAGKADGALDRTLARAYPGRALSGAG